MIKVNMLSFIFILFFYIYIFVCYLSKILTESRKGNQNLWDCSYCRKGRAVVGAQGVKPWSLGRATSALTCCAISLMSPALFNASA